MVGKNVWVPNLPKTTLFPDLRPGGGKNWPEQNVPKLSKCHFPILVKILIFSNFQKWSGNHDHFRNMQKSWLISSQYFAFSQPKPLLEQEEITTFPTFPQTDKINWTNKSATMVGNFFECQTFQKQPCFQIYDQGVVKIDQSKVVHFLTN